MVLSSESVARPSSAYVARPPRPKLGRLAPLLLVAVDLALILLVFVASWFARDLATPLLARDHDPIGFGQGLAFMLTLIPVFAAAGLYPGYAVGPVEQVRRRVHAIVGTILALFVFDRLLGGTDQSRLVLFVVLVALLVLSPLVSIAARAALSRAGLWGMPAVLVGDRADGEELARLLRAHPETGLVPAGFLDTGASGTKSELDGLPLLDGASGLDGLDGAVAVIARPPDGAEMERLIATLPFSRLIVMPVRSTLAGHSVRLTELGGMLGLDLRRSGRKPVRRLKRATDLALALPMLLLFGPPMLLAALAVKLTSRGPVLFRQLRCGEGGHPFVLLKFRTMQVDAEARLAELLRSDPAVREEYQRFHKLRRDPRVTPVGRFLRKTSLDELPQLWNVVRGDMSLVGPRPYIPAELMPRGPEERRILSVPPGLTGLWQISARNSVSFQERKAMDLWYTRNWSVWLDVYILYLTVLAVLKISKTQ